MNIYKNKKIPMCESVLLPIHDNKGNIVQDLHLGVRQQFLLHARDSIYNGSWKKLERDIASKGESELRDLTIVKNLEEFEEKYNVNLGELLREWVPLE